jgi:hypothetical protein
MNFSGDDMRFFHQFLSLAYPHLPLGSEEAWIMNVPLYAHEVRQHYIREAAIMTANASFSHPC